MDDNPSLDGRDGRSSHAIAWLLILLPALLFEGCGPDLDLEKKAQSLLGPDAGVEYVYEGPDGSRVTATGTRPGDDGAVRVREVWTWPREMLPPELPVNISVREYELAARGARLVQLWRGEVAILVDLSSPEWRVPGVLVNMQGLQKNLALTARIGSRSTEHLFGQEREVFQVDLGDEGALSNTYATGIGLVRFQAVDAVFRLVRINHLEMEN